MKLLPCSRAFSVLATLPAIMLALAIAVSVSPAAAADDKKDDPGGSKPGQRDNPNAPEKGPHDNPNAPEKGPRDNPNAPERGPKDDPNAKPKEGGDPGPDGKKPAAGAPANSKEGKMFVAYDKDSSGAVTAEEIEAMIEGEQNSRGRREIRKALDRADANEDGVLSFEEFAWWLQHRGDEREKNR